MYIHIHIYIQRETLPLQIKSTTKTESRYRIFISYRGTIVFDACMPNTGNAQSLSVLITWRCQKDRARSPYSLFIFISSLFRAQVTRHNRASCNSRILLLFQIFRVCTSCKSNKQVGDNIIELSSLCGIVRYFSSFAANNCKTNCALIIRQSSLA